MSGGNRCFHKLLFGYARIAIINWLVFTHYTQNDKPVSELFLTTSKGGLF